MIVFSCILTKLAEVSLEALASEVPWISRLHFRSPTIILKMRGATHLEAKRDLLSLEDVSSCETCLFVLVCSKPQSQLCALSSWHWRSC